MDSAGTIPRRALQIVRNAMTDTPVVAINGPRQVGKSTLARQLLDGANGLLLTLDDDAQRASAISDPRGYVERENVAGPVVIDEVQLAPPLFRAVKASVDRNRNAGRYVLTGSTRLLSAKGFADALVGRIETVEIWPFTQGELDDEPDGFVDWAFSGRGPTFAVGTLTQAGCVERLARGGFPEAVKRPAARRKKWFDAYLTTLTQRVVSDVASVERASEIPRLVRLCAARSGEELNTTRIAGQLGLPARTVDGYLALLSNVFVVQLIPAWSTNLSKKVVRSPKLVVVDSGLACHLTGMNVGRVGDPTAPFGQLLESFVAMELRKQLTWSDQPVTLSHFRDRDGAEVDLVLEHANGDVVGVEVKAARSVSSRDTRGLRFLAERLGARFKAGIVLSLMPEVTPLGDQITALPLEALWRF